MAIKKIKEFAKIRRGASPRPINDPKYFGGNVGWVRIADVSASNKYLRKTTQYVSPLGESLSVRVDKGDLIMSIAGTVGRPMIVDMPACIHDGFVHIYDFSNANNEYLYYYLQFFEENIKSLGQSGTQTNLNTSIVGEIDIFFPEIKEQSTIALILSTIDRAIEKTERLIAKYERIKTGLMQDLLTRGIDEQGRIRSEETHAFKDSALGRVPVEWEVGAVKDYLNYISYGFTNPMPTTEIGPVMISATNIFDGRIQYETCRLTSQKDFNTLLTPKSKPQIGDVLMTKDGTLGRLAIVDRENLCITQSVAIMRTKSEKIDRTFFKTLLESPKYQKTIHDESGGSTIKHVYITKLAKMQIAIPKSVDEQVRILDGLRTILNSLNELYKQLNNYKSTKTGLMQDLLTGRVRVDGLIYQP